MRALLFAISVAGLLAGCVTTAKEGPPSTLTGPEQPLVGEAGSNEARYVPSSGWVMLRNSNGKRFHGEYLSATQRRTTGGSDDVSDVRVTEWGNRISRTGGKEVVITTPHNGFLPEEPMEVGLAWEKRVLVTDSFGTHWWDRKCRLAGRGTVTVAAGTFADAWRIECTSRREDGWRAVDATAWYSSRGRIILISKARWNTGSIVVELTDFSVEPRVAVLGRESGLAQR